VHGNRYADLLETVLDAALLGTRYFAAGESFLRPAEYRLAFRELGLSIGLEGLGMIEDAVAKRPDRSVDARRLLEPVASLKRLAALGDRLEAFWSDSANQEACTWTEHKEINMVMLATSLAPGEFLRV